MRASRRQSGDVPVGCLVGLVVLAVVALIAIKTIPVITRVGEFDKTITAMADRANRLDYPDTRIRARLIDKAGELDLPVQPEQIKITRSKSRIKIEVTYDLEIDFPFYTYRWHKVHFQDRPVIR